MMKNMANTGKEGAPRFRNDEKVLTNQEVIDFYEHLAMELKIQRSTYMIIISAIVAVFLFGLLFLGYRYYRVDSYYSGQVLAAQRFKRDLETAKAEIEKLRKGTETLLTGGIPGLLPFEFNQDFDVNNKYVRRITFDESTSETDRGEGYQCRISLFNKTESTVLPELTLLFFDKDGFVIDYVHLSNMSGAAMKGGALKPNEKRTDISPVISVPDPAKKPAYFLLRVR